MLIFLLNLFSHFYPTYIDLGSCYLKVCFVVLKKWQAYFFAKPSLWEIDTKNVSTTTFLRVLTNNYFVIVVVVVVVVVL